jgi:hypothetical protein
MDKKLTIALVNAVIAYAAAGFFLNENINMREGLASCIENVQTKCGPITAYAISLENENARLNKKMAACICPEAMD